MNKRWQDFYMRERYPIVFELPSTYFNTCDTCYTGHFFWCQIITRTQWSTFQVSSSFLKRFKGALPDWTYFMLNVYKLGKRSTDGLRKEFHNIWCLQKSTIHVDFFRSVYKSLPLDILLILHPYFQYVTYNENIDSRNCNEKRIDFDKLLQLRNPRFKLRVVFHAVTLFAYLIKKIYEPGKPIVKQLEINFNSTKLKNI